MTHEDRFIGHLSKIAAFKERTLAIPDKLFAARLALSDADDAVKTAKRSQAGADGDVKDSENEVALDVSSNKAAFPNEAARRMETRRRLSVNETHQQFVKAAAVAEQGVFRAEHARMQQALVVQKIEDEQRALRTHADLTGSEVLLLTAGR